MRKVVVWFCSSQDSELKELISDFSVDLDSPVFLPHVTLLGTVEMMDSFSYENAIRNIVKDWSPLEITLDGIGFEDSFWRCFYYKAFPQKNLSQFHLELANGLAAFGAQTSSDFMPHLSLAYTKIGILQQQAFFEKHKDILFPKKLIFDCIKVVHFVPEDVNAWKILTNIGKYFPSIL